MKQLITFGSHLNYIDAGTRLIKQANDLNVLDSIQLYTVDDLKQDNLFWEKHSDFILKNKRGFGYYLWKPYLIQKTMMNMNDGDILLWVDAGCEIVSNERKYMIKYFEIVKKAHILYTFASTEKEWTKMDLIKKMGMNDNRYLDSPQRAAGLVMFYVCEKTRKFVDEWYEIGNNNYSFIDDTPSVEPNYSSFKEHRHDQSIFSLLTKKYKFDYNMSLRGRCILTLRNRSGVSKLPLSNP